LGLDTAHGTGNALAGACSDCHSTAPPFQGGTLPANHIKLITGAACVDCHALGYAPGTTTMVHNDVTQTPCAACHSTTTVFSGTGQGTNGQPWQMPAVSTTGGHIPIGALDCANSGCHVVSNPMTANGAGFQITAVPALSAAGHTAVTATQACQACHALGMSFKLVAPATMVAPASNHIPPDNTSTPTVACSGCHAATSVGTGGFKLTGTVGTAAPVMTAAMHTVVSSVSCNTCHEASAANLGFQGITTNIILRPGYGANSGYNFTAALPTTLPAPVPSQTDTNHQTTAAEATPNDCSGCHTTTPPFANGTAIPANHITIASGAVCASCHTGGTNSVVLPMPHTSVTGTCASCHNNATKFAGSVFTPTGTSGGTFGTQTGANFQARQIIASPAVGATGGHIPPPTADDCNVCHLSTSAFGPGTAMVHTNISSGCASCHASTHSWYGVTNLATTLKTTGGVVMSPLHVPMTTPYVNACELCHSATQFTNFKGGKVDHTSGTTHFMVYTSKGSSSPTCDSCHAPSGTKWYGISLSTATMGSHHSSTTSADCINCHGTGSFGAAAAAAVMHRPTMHAMTGPSAGVRQFPHGGVMVGSCAGCHSAAGGATPQPPGHLPTALPCDACHRTSTWLPALFAHAGVAPGACASCHVGNWATPRPAGHLQTQRTCDTCHHDTTAWLPVTYAHFDTIYSPHSAAVPCASCHTSGTEQVVWKFPTLQPGCAGCHGPQFRGGANRKMLGHGVNPRNH
jgi:hypothetical protein